MVTFAFVSSFATLSVTANGYRHLLALALHQLPLDNHSVLTQALRATATGPSSWRWRAKWQHRALALIAATEARTSAAALPTSAPAASAWGRGDRRRGASC
jgi:hypothetical protein